MYKTQFFFSNLFCFEQAIGPNGLQEQELEKSLEQGYAAQSVWQEKKEYPLFRSVFQEDYLPQIQKEAQKLFKYKDIIVFGTGGSSLGGQCLQQLAKAHAPRFFFLDNIDPATIEPLLNRNWSETGLIVISKSGETAETLLQFLVALQKIRTQISDSSIHKHLTIITEPKPSSLSKLADYFNCPILPHDLGIGGRFAVLSSVGLLPALLMGLKLDEFRHGAQFTLDAFQKTPKGQVSNPLLGASIQAAFLKRGITKTVMMPYFDKGEKFASWFAQLWGESLGKEGKGLTPIKAMGAIDQHSQLQLYLDGPKDKFFTLLCLEQKGLGTLSGNDLGFTENLKNLSLSSLGDLMEAEQRATYETLGQNGCPTRLIRMSEWNEQIMGSLFMHFMLETILTAEYLGVNAFNQPAVEQGKILAQTYLKQKDTQAA